MATQHKVRARRRTPSSTEFVDPYLDPETGLLRNLVGARDNTTHVAAEGALVFARAVQLLDRPAKPTGDLTELRAITVFSSRTFSTGPDGCGRLTFARTSSAQSSFSRSR